MEPRFTTRTERIGVIECKCHRTQIRYDLQRSPGLLHFSSVCIPSTVQPRIPTEQFKSHKTKAAINSNSPSSSCYYSSSRIPRSKPPRDCQTSRRSQNGGSWNSQSHLQVLQAFPLEEWKLVVVKGAVAARGRIGEATYTNRPRGTDRSGHISPERPRGG